MRRLCIILLSILSLAAFAQQSKVEVLPEWFIHPAEHTYVGISVPGGNVQEAVNVALLHYLISKDFSGKMLTSVYSKSSAEMHESSNEGIFQIDTTLQYSIEEIISTAKDEYICRISDKPRLRRRIAIAAYYKHNMEKNVDSWRESVLLCKYDFVYADNTGESVTSVQMKQKSVDREKTYSYISQYKHENGLYKEYENSGSQSLGEQLLLAYIQRLKEGFTQTNKESHIRTNDVEEKIGNIVADRHVAMPITEFGYDSGYLYIKK